MVVNPHSSSTMMQNDLKTANEEIMRLRSELSAARNQEAQSSNGSQHKATENTWGRRLNQFSSTDGYEFLEWKSTAERTIKVLKWDYDRAMMEIDSAIVSPVRQQVAHILKNEHPSASKCLEQIEKVLLHDLCSTKAISEFEQLKQLPGETCRDLHARVRRLFIRAYPDLQDAQPEPLQLRLKFINSLTNASARHDIMLVNPGSFREALEAAERWFGSRQETGTEVIAATEYVRTEQSRFRGRGQQNWRGGYQSSQYRGRGSLRGNAGQFRQRQSWQPRGRGFARRYDGPGLPKDDLFCAVCMDNTHRTNRCKFVLRAKSLRGSDRGARGTGSAPAGQRRNIAAVMEGADMDSPYLDWNDREQGELAETPVAGN